jgi:hypothetical protein
MISPPAGPFRGPALRVPCEGLYASEQRSPAQGGGGSSGVKTNVVMAVSSPQSLVYHVLDMGAHLGAGGSEHTRLGIEEENMSERVTLQLPDNVLHSAREVATRTHRRVEDVLGSCNASRCCRACVKACWARRGKTWSVPYFRLFPPAALIGVHEYVQG